MKKDKSKIKILIYSTIIFVICHLTIYSQNNSQPEIVKSDGNACELNSMNLDKFKTDWLSTNLKEQIFVILHLGKKETSRSVNLLRLKSIKFAMLAKGNFPKENIIFAEGEKVEKEGRIEFYLGSRLIFVSLASLNKNICFICCNDRPKIKSK